MELILWGFYGFYGFCIFLVYSWNHSIQRICFGIQFTQWQKKVYPEYLDRLGPNDCKP